MPPNVTAQLLLRKAAEDEALLDEVIESLQVSDAVYGFHAQQSAEKLLKATLAQEGIAFPFTHRLTLLIDLVRDNGIDLPDEFDELNLLTPFAVEYRYDVLPEEDEEPLDRLATRGLLRRLRAWIEARLPL